jgi:glycerol uptake facilitator-like aquaporin
MNPAVTFSMIITKNIKLTRGLIYIVVQFAGAFVGAALCYGTGLFSFSLAASPP